MKWIAIAGILLATPAQAGPQFPTVMRGEWCYSSDNGNGGAEYVPKYGAKCNGSAEEMMTITKTYIHSFGGKCRLTKGLLFRDSFTDEWHGATAIVYLAKLVCQDGIVNPDSVLDVKLWIPARGMTALVFEFKEERK